MDLREKMASLFRGPLVEEQRKLMGLGPSLPSLAEAKEPKKEPKEPEDWEPEDTWGDDEAHPPPKREDVDTEAVDPPDAEVDPDTEHGIHLSTKAHELSDLAHQAHSWEPPLDPHYVHQLHFRAHDAHDEAHGHWTQVAKNHDDPATRQVAADISGEHADAKGHHALAMQKIKDKEPESHKGPEVYHAGRSKRVA